MTEQAWTPGRWYVQDYATVPPAGEAYSIVEFLRLDAGKRIVETRALVWDVRAVAERIAADHNALAGIDDPAALRKLLNDLRQWRQDQCPDDSHQREALYAILDDLYDMIPRATEPKR